MMLAAAPIARPDLYVAYEDATFYAKDYYSSMTVTGPGVTGGLRNWVPPIDAQPFSLVVDPSTRVLTASAPTTAAGPGWQLVLAPPVGLGVTQGSSYDHVAIYPNQVPQAAGISFTSPVLTASAVAQITSGQFTVYFGAGGSGDFATRFQLFGADLNTPIVTGELAYFHYDVQWNDEDPAGTITTSVLSPPAHGTLNLQPDGQFDYTPVHGFTGIDTFAYSDTSVNGTSPDTLVTIHVLPTPTPAFVPGPDQTAGKSSGPQRAPGWLADIRAASEITHHPLTFVTTGNTNPSLFSDAPVVNASNLSPLYYTPAPGKTGSATITMVLRETDPVSGQTFDSAPHSFKIDVVEPTDPAVANPEMFTVPEGGVINDPSFSVLTNDVDLLGYPMTAVLDHGPAHGSLTLNADGTFIYTPATFFAGVDSFTYIARPAEGPDSAPATVSITVNLVNQTPYFTAGPDVTVDEDAGLVTIPHWATNISPGQPVEVGVQQLTFYVNNETNSLLLQGGPARISADGTLTFTPAANLSGTDTLTIRLSDGTGLTGSGNDSSQPVTFTITVTPVNDGASAQEDVFETEENQPLTIGGTSAPAPQTWMWINSVSPEDPVGKGDLVVRTLADANFWPQPNYYNGSTAQIEVSPKDSGVAWTLSFTAPSYTPLVMGTYTADGLLYTAPGRSFLKVVPTSEYFSSEMQGTFTVLAAVRPLTYDASITSFAVDFTQQMKTTNGGLTPPLNGKLRFNYTPPVSVLANDTDIDSPAVTTAKLVTQPAHGTLFFSANGSFTYTPSAGFAGTDSFTYAASDGQKFGAPATVTLIVAPPHLQGKRNGTVKNAYPLTPGVSSAAGNLGSVGATPLAGWTVYDDANGNSQLDADETSAVTDLDGKYTLALLTGSQLVRVEEKPGWATPAFDGGGADVVTVDVGDGTTEIPTLYTSMQTPTVIDVLAVYTNQARESRSGDQMNAMVNDLFAKANRVFANSDTNVRINLVASEPVSYQQSGNFDFDLFLLSNPHDGVMDDVPVRRDALNADLVVLISGDEPNSPEIGVAYEMTRAPYAAKLGYGVVALLDSTTTAASDDDAATLAHELGHTLGADHDIANSRARGIYPFAHGYNYVSASYDHTVYQDVMSYGDGTTLPFFSTPRFSWAGAPVGTATADDSLAVRLNAPAVSRYRIGGDEPLVKSAMLALTAVTSRVLPARASVLAGAPGRALLKLINGGDDIASGTVQVSLYLSSSPTTITDEVPMTSISLPVRILPGRMRALPVRFNYMPGLPSGTYYVLAQIESAGSTVPVEELAQSTTVRTVDYATGFVDLSLTIRPAGLVMKTGRPAAVVVTVQNKGNVPLNGIVNFQLHASADSTLSDDDRSLLSRPIRIFRTGGLSRAVLLVFRVPTDIAAGDYSLIATITPDASLGDTNTSDKTAVGSVTIS